MFNKKDNVTYPYPWLEKEFAPVQMVTKKGELQANAEQYYDPDLLKVLYGCMLRARMFDRKAINLQRQGRIGTYAPFEGQEAAQIGSAYAVKEEQWLIPTYRDQGAILTFGQSLLHLLLYWQGRVEGCAPPEEKDMFPPAVPIATQILHAVGVAWAEKLKGGQGVVLGYFGDGATSEGDFHEGLNFASVFQVPVVLFAQNNRFAISVPIARQMHSRSIAQKAVAYDIPGVLVDGNDVLAVYQVTKEAVERAKSGLGPTLIEAVTWRYGAHTTADDPTKYRNQTESEQRREFDPLERVEKLLRQHGDWDHSWVEEVKQQFEQEIEQAVQEMESYPQADPAYMFAHVFQEPTWNMLEQRAVLFKGGEGL